MSHRVSWITWGRLVGLLTLLAAMPTAQPALAQDPVGSCIDDVTDFDVVCAASDVGLSEFINVTGELTCTPGELITVNLRLRAESTSKERYDIGLFVALDGGDARTGTCQHDFLPPPLEAAGSYNPGSPDAGGGPFYNGEPEDALDACGDLEQGVPVYYDLGIVTVPCIDSDGDGLLNIGTAVSWDNKKDNTCLDVGGAVPNTPAKCRFARVDVANVYVEPGDIQVSKTADPTELPEPGGTVTFTFVVQNPSEGTVVLQTLVDSVYGFLPSWEGSDCAVPQTLGPGASYQCSISAEVTGALGIHSDTVTAQGIDDLQNVVSDTATAEVLLVGR